MYVHLTIPRSPWGRPQTLADECTHDIFRSCFNASRILSFHPNELYQIAGETRLTNIGISLQIGKESTDFTHSFRLEYTSYHLFLLSKSEISLFVFRDHSPGVNLHHIRLHRVSWTSPTKSAPRRYLFVQIHRSPREGLPRLKIISFDPDYKFTQKRDMLKRVTFSPDATMQIEPTSFTEIADREQSHQQSCKI